ncbi:MAG: beta-1,6-N-acetylglucosaminyltransferase [Rhodoplanes sp.]
MRIALVLQTYRGLDQVGRLIDTLNQGCPDNLLVIVHSGSRDELQELTGKHRIDRALSTAPARGRFGLIDGYLSALRWLHRQDKPYDWVVLLSGQDYPIRPLGALRETLERSPVDGYCYYFDPLDERGAGSGKMAWSIDEARNRYFFRYSFMTEQLSLIERAALRLPKLALARTRNYRLRTSFGLGLGRRAERTPFSSEFGLYAGSYWNIIRRECAETLIDFVDENPDIVDYFRQVILPDESFVQTVLLNNGGFHLSPFDLRYFDFSGSRHGHSKTLNATDLPAAFASKCFFARKFDAVMHPGILDHLDLRVLG